MAVAVTLYETEIGVLLSLSEEQRGRILTAILCDTTGKELPEMDASDNAIFTLVNAQVKRAAELSNKRKQSAKSRWQNQATDDSNGEQEEQGDTTAMQNDTNNLQNDTSGDICTDLHNTNQCTITNTNTITKTNTNTITMTETGTNTEATPASANSDESKPKKPKKSAPEKKRYADFVTLTEEEYNKLVEQYGTEAVKWCIQKLDNYKGSTGKKYASDYRTILSWVIASYNKEQAKHSQPAHTIPPGGLKLEQQQAKSRNPFINAVLNGGGDNG